MTIAVLLANRGFFPSSVIDAAREEMSAALKKAGITPLFSPADITKYGAVETTLEGFAFRDFLEAHRGEYDGLIICLPNFGDENGIKAAIRDVTVPILLQAYPDEIGQMDFEHRRDSLCGKLALTSVLKQMGTKFTSFTPFVVHPSSEEFGCQLSKFAAICRVVKRMKYVRLGAIGARTTAFKSVRFDEVAFEGHGIDVESLDLSSVLARMDKFTDDDPSVQEWIGKLHAVADFGKAPDGKDLMLAKLGATLVAIADEMKLDCLAIRCWSELQEMRGISPCSVMGILNHEGLPAVCEMDVTNALPMLALAAASGRSSGCLDWNNNYGADPDKCILFHCGPLPSELMTGPGEIQSHKMLDKSYGDGCSWGLNVGKIAPGEISFSSLRTENGRLQYYVDKGEITSDPVEDAFFGCPGVLHVPGLQDKLQHISEGGFRHHVIITGGDVVDVIQEAFTKYLDYDRVTL
ncbi:hypothetical protein LJC33_06805 [Eubacteriales bacterium OttesenSCG-928-N13]|nr:hypothetical protein [Eubacteriales bacterium OttesenSCG-928-N13]